jgi:hypothetical protein
MIKKLIMLGVCLVALVLFAESIEPGLTPLKCSGDSLYDDGVYITTDAATDTSYSAWYSTADIGDYNSIRLVVDSVRGACSLKVVLQESWDNNNITNIEFQTTLFYDNIAVARLDTVLELNAYPAPNSRLLLYECDAAATESLQIDTLSWFSK